jgi:hypothetical protein
MPYDKMTLTLGIRELAAWAGASASTPVNNLLSEFLHLTRPIGVQQEVSQHRPPRPHYIRSTNHLRTIWFSRLPTKIQTSLACHPELDLKAAAACINEIVSLLVLTSIDQSADYT